MWLKLEHLPEHIKDRQMFVVKAFDVLTPGSYKRFDTMPCCVFSAGESFIGWPHAFKPTHFCLLPEGRE